MPTIEQLDELDAILDHIEAHPEEWEQEYYGLKTECKTAYCVAGHTLVRAGVQMTWMPLDEVNAGNPEEWELDVAFDPHTHEPRNIQVLAAEILGLTSDQATELFLGSNSFDRLREVAHGIRHDLPLGRQGLREIA